MNREQAEKQLRDLATVFELEANYCTEQKDDNGLENFGELVFQLLTIADHLKADWLTK